jgi:hypothetical protein
VLLKTYTRHTVEHDGLELEIPYTDPYGMDVEDTMLFGRTPDGKIVVSYLVSDDWAQDLDPSKEDCSGWQHFTVFESQRDADAVSAMFNCESCDYPWVDHLDDDGNMRTDLESWIGCDGWTPPAAQLALDAGRAFFFEKYEHGLVNYALRGESSRVDRQWDVTNFAGFMWADDEWGDGVDIKDAARNFLETYTDWCNGCVYGIVHCTYEPDGTYIDEESCWGFIGSDYAERELRDEHGGYLT